MRGGETTPDRPTDIWEKFIAIFLRNVTDRDLVPSQLMHLYSSHLLNTALQFCTRAPAAREEYHTGNYYVVSPSKV
jgi:hypothetical protein